MGTHCMCTMLHSIVHMLNLTRSHMNDCDLRHERSVSCPVHACMVATFAAITQAHVGTVVQLPSLKHGDKIIADSAAIFDYLKETFPEKMKVFEPDTARECAA